MTYCKQYDGYDRNVPRLVAITTLVAPALRNFLVLGISPGDVLVNECDTLLKVAKNIAHGLPPHDCVCGFANRSTALVARL